MSAEQEVKAAIEERMQALRAGNAPKLEQLLAEEVSFVNAAGFVQGRTRLVDDFKSGDIKVAAAEANEIDVKIYGDAAIAVYRAMMNATYKGQSRSGQFRVTAVYLRQAGSWKIVAQQQTHLSQPAPR